MLYTRSYLFLSLLALAFTACDGSFFDSEIELPVPEHEPVMAINCFINSTDEENLSVWLARTYGLFEEGVDIEPLAEANIQLWENGSLAYLIPGGGPAQNSYFTDLDGPFEGYGNEYELRITHPTYGTATARQVMPEPVPISEAKFREVAGTDFSGNMGEFQIEFTDPPNEENYYELAALQTCSYTYIDEFGNVQTEEYEEQVYFNMDMTTDPNIVEGYAYDALLINGQNIDGQSYTLRPQFYYCFTGDPDADYHFTLYWRTVTKEYFLYSKSLLESQNAADNPFSEPVALFSNIEGGVGAFCLKAEEVVEVEE